MPVMPASAADGLAKGQKKGDCGHIMAAWDNHPLCRTCRAKEPSLRFSKDPVLQAQIRQFPLCSGPRVPCHFCELWDERRWDLTLQASERKAREKLSKSRSRSVSIEPPSLSRAAPEESYGSISRVAGSLGTPVESLAAPPSSEVEDQSAATPGHLNLPVLNAPPGAGTSRPRGSRKSVSRSPRHSRSPRMPETPEFTRGRDPSGGDRFRNSSRSPRKPRSRSPGDREPRSGRHSRSSASGTRNAGNTGTSRHSRSISPRTQHSQRSRSSRRSESPRRSRSSRRSRGSQRSRSSQRSQSPRSPRETRESRCSSRSRRTRRSRSPWRSGSARGTKSHRRSRSPRRSRSRDGHRRSQGGRRSHSCSSRYRDSRSRSHSRRPRYHRSRSRQRSYGSRDRSPRGRSRSHRRPHRESTSYSRSPSPGRSRHRRAYSRSRSRSRSPVRERHSRGRSRSPPQRRRDRHSRDRRNSRVSRETRSPHRAASVEESSGEEREGSPSSSDAASDTEEPAKLSERQLQAMISKIIQNTLPQLLAAQHPSEPLNPSEQNPPRELTPPRREADDRSESVDLGAPSAEEIRQLDDDLPRDSPTPTPSVAGSVAGTEQDPSAAQKRRAVLREVIERLGLPQPNPPSKPAFGLEGLPLEAPAVQAPPSFRWSTKTVELVEELSQLMRGHGPLAKQATSRKGQEKAQEEANTSSTDRCWEVGKKFFPPALPQPLHAVHKGGYKPSDSHVLPVEATAAETGVLMPFTDGNKKPIDLNHSVEVKAKTLTDCESVARLTCCAANSANTLLRFLREPQADFTLPETAMMVVDQIAYDLSAILHFCWRDAANWQLLRRQAALEGPLKDHLSLEERNLLYSAPLTGPFLFGPLVEGKSALQVIRDRKVKKAAEDASLHLAMTAETASSTRARKRTAQEAGLAGFKIPQRPAPHSGGRRSGAQSTPTTTSKASYSQTSVADKAYPQPRATSSGYQPKKKKRYRPRGGRNFGGSNRGAGSGKSHSK